MAFYTVKGGIGGFKGTLTKNFFFFNVARSTQSESAWERNEYT